MKRSCDACSLNGDDYCCCACIVQPVPSTRSSKDHALTYAFSPRFRLTPDAMFYGRFASGFRPGGPNINRGFPNVPESFDPDYTYNYELGFKGKLFQEAIVLDTSIYYIDWKDLRLSNLFTPPPLRAAFTGNAGGAKSYGWELTLEIHPAKGTTVSATGALSNAELTKDWPAFVGYTAKKGDELPFSARFTGSLSVEQEFELGKAAIGYVGGTLSYVGKRFGGFSGTRERLPSYTNTDVHAGVRLNKWDINIYANNVFDKRNILWQGITESEVFNVVAYTQPRTLGMTISFKF